jgi:murein DD-endopeptidase MepM/ murein hydrolase activator NlpD
LLLALGVLAACDRVGPPAPYEQRITYGAPAQAAAPGPHPDSITVAGGDTLYGVARRYGVPTRAIIDANHLSPPYRLVAGRVLVLPQVRTHQVRAGDTLRSVARLYGVDMSTLAATNHLAPPYVIRTGESLILPSPVEGAVAAAPAAAPQQGVAAAPLAAPVAQGPPAAASFAPAPPPERPAATVAAANPAPSPAAAPEAAPVAASAPPQAPPKPEETATIAPPPPAPIPGKGFLWPVHGTVLSAYGTAADGIHNDGINIAAPAGTPVVAAEAGEVAYAGNELKGYGNLVLIKHPDGYITAYAHLQSMLVKRYDKVARGQQIGSVGATGAVSAPQLHFEIRRGARAVDPAGYLRSGTAAKS